MKANPRDVMHAGILVTATITVIWICNAIYDALLHASQKGLQ